ncbi:1, 4-beta cellobiohydrolase [Cladorrhinum sp. PSN259]|nr:1, 4-beta cellobiohydrolase [Cladorrhinum sp. PSN259]
MKLQLFFLLTFGNAIALPSSRSAACPSLSLNVTTNIWTEYALHPNPLYRQRVLEAASKIQDPILQQKARKVADVGSFLWLSESTDIVKIPRVFNDVPCNHIVGIVLQGMYSPGNCTLPKFKTVEADTYRKDFVDPLVTIIKSNPTTAFALILEPSALPPAIIHQNLTSCAPFIASYRTNIPYALQALNLHNVILYIDAGHGGNLGWDKNLIQAAKELSLIYTLSNRPSQLRGFATNVANYNSWDLSPGEFDRSAREEWPENHAQNEQKYVRMLGQALAKVGVPNRAVVDTSRSGVQGLRYEWLDWCNVDGAGFGRLPGVIKGSGTGTSSELADAFIWAKGGGVSDGTSDKASEEYEEACGMLDAYKPSPGRGEWNQGYFEMLLREARPEIKV